ncbi:hypothetical protein AAFF_G00244940 [Aldrovandia affinis]|uniref:Uncharacterized protein n=1 Tax=Aldrovandia affinis TaxID=143900 RepID=A0AAD7RDS5_9TELE|nr:hypothetical protein AAFF_G00244940 [Aldrovandia affinis]
METRHSTGRPHLDKQASGMCLQASALDPSCRLAIMSFQRIGNCYAARPAPTSAVSTKPNAPHRPPPPTGRSVSGAIRIWRGVQELNYLDEANNSHESQAGLEPTTLGCWVYDGTAESPCRVIALSNTLSGTRDQGVMFGCVGLCRLPLRGPPRIRLCGQATQRPVSD